MVAGGKVFLTQSSTGFGRNLGTLCVTLHEVDNRKGPIGQ